MPTRLSYFDFLLDLFEVVLDVPVFEVVVVLVELTLGLDLVLVAGVLGDLGSSLAAGGVLESRMSGAGAESGVASGIINSYSSAHARMAR